MKIHQVRWYSLNKLRRDTFSIRHEHATVRWYTHQSECLDSHFVLCSYTNKLRNQKERKKDEKVVGLNFSIEDDT